jgi:branched-chain amino acid transport system ATP-binding protein
MLALLEGRGLTKRFGGLVAVRQVDVDIAEREIVGLIGPNGSGKTTLFNVIAGYYKPDAGSLLFRGHAISGLPPDRICRAGIARTFQLSRPLLDMSILDNVVVAVLYGASGIRSVSAARVEAERVLQRVGLGDDIRTPTEQLTLVQRKRLEIARALATRPALLLLDETMSGLNGDETTAAVSLLRRLRDEDGLALLIVEHVMDVIMGLCDRVMVLTSGAKIADGPPAEVVANPAVVGAYLGARWARADAARR